MELDGIAVPVLLTVASMLGLWWHFVQARKGAATLRDRAMGGIWAAMLVLAAGRVLWLMSHPPTGRPAPAVPAAPDPAATK